MRGSGDLRDLAEQLDIGWSVIELVVTDQAAERLAAQLAVLLFIELLEERALVPGHAFVLLEGPAQILLRDVHDTDLEHLIRFGVVDEVAQAAPGALHL